MIQSLSIKNVAVIKNIDVEFGEGLNILLGETGAGKSIIFDSLNFVLGAKADRTLIRTGENEMRVDAVFSNLSSNVQAFLKELGFDGEEIGLSRSLTIGGRSSVRINGIPVVLSVLKEVGELLVDSYSQHENVELLKSKNHLNMLDKFGGEEVGKLKEKIRSKHCLIYELNKKLANLGGDEFERERKKSLLDYQIKEIEDAELKQGEEDELNEKLKFFTNAEKIYESISICQTLLDNGVNSCISALQQSSNALAGLVNFNEINDCRERLESARYEVSDICDTLEDIKSSTDFDEREFEKLDRRSDLIKSITKKYGGNIESALMYLSKAKDEFSMLEDSEVMLSKLEKEKSLLEKEMKDVSLNLSGLRKKIALGIKNKVNIQLKQLGMKSSIFEIKFSEMEKIGIDGIDDVEFVFSANKGQEAKSLSKTASGGELSRFMLAFKTIFASAGTAQTLIFDEIDAGISGETGNIVGDKLNNITKETQVLCITHLPQVACYGDDFYFVSKRESNDNTVAEIKHLQNDEISYNIARMIVGDKVSDIALKQTEEMRVKAGKV